MNLFSPQKIEMHQSIIYAWFTSTNPNQIPNFIYCLTPHPKPIRQGKRLTPQAFFTKVTGGTCHAFAQVPIQHTAQFIDELTAELCAQSYPMFDPHNGEPLFHCSEAQAEADHPIPLSKPPPAPPAPHEPPEPHKPPLLRTQTNHLADFPDLLSTPPHPIYILSLMHQVARRIKQAEQNRARVNKHRSFPPHPGDELPQPKLYLPHNPQEAQEN